MSESPVKCIRFDGWVGSYVNTYGNCSGRRLTAECGVILSWEMAMYNGYLSNGPKPPSLTKNSSAVARRESENQGFSFSPYLAGRQKIWALIADFPNDWRDDKL